MPPYFGAEMAKKKVYIIEILRKKIGDIIRKEQVN